MMSTWLDVLVRALLGAVAVLAQLLIVNWLGLPFAAITLFSGLAAYGVAVALNFAPLGGLVFVSVAVILLVLFSALVRPLPEDRYLLLTLASLALARSLAGTLPRLGGQTGMTSAAVFLPFQQPRSFLVWAVLLFLTTVAILYVLQHSQLGLAVDVTRLSRSEGLAAALVPESKLITLSLAVACLLAMSAGGLQVLYSGRVDPNVFKIDAAVTILMTTLVAGRGAVKAPLVAIAFFVFPDVFASTLGYQTSAMAHLREIVWGCLILLITGRDLGRQQKADADAAA